MTRRRGRRGTAERGSATLEIAILGPALLLLVFTVVQVALWFYARSLALAAAQEGVAAARGYSAPTAAGVARAHAFLDRSAGDSLQAARVTATPAGIQRVRIEVTGRALSVVPGVPGPAVTQSAEGPVERFTTPGGAP
jgi:Flp pilus assembly protein TadG